MLILPRVPLPTLNFIHLPRGIGGARLVHLVLHLFALVAPGCFGSLLFCGFFFVCLDVL
jgi:hypothetical protein